MACASVDMVIHEADGGSRRELPKIQRYAASEILPDVKGPLHDLLQKQPAVLGSVQMVSGLLNVGIGIFFAIASDVEQSLSTMFRVSPLIGMLFFIAGGLSNLLFKYPRLLPVSLMVNYGCIIVAVATECLIIAELLLWTQDTNYLQIKLLEVFVLVLEVILSAILCSWFSQEKHSKSP